MLIPLITSNSGIVEELIFTRRASHMSTHSGEVAFPGGKRDEEDQDLIATALRESYEEIALLPDNVKIIGTLGPVISRFGIKVVPYIGAVTGELELKPNISELDRIFTVPLDFFADQENLQYNQLSMDGQPYTMPSYQFGEYHIWGLTAIMLAEFLNVALKTEIPLETPHFSPKQATFFKKR